MRRQGRATVSNGHTNDLPEGVCLRRTPDGDYELRIVAPDADALLWRLHDVVEMVQYGALQARLVESADEDAPGEP